MKELITKQKRNDLYHGDKYNFIANEDEKIKIIGKTRYVLNNILDYLFPIYFFIIGKPGSGRAVHKNPLSESEWLAKMNEISKEQK